MIKTTHDLLAEHPFLEGLSDEWLERLSYQSTRVVYHVGDRLFGQDGPAEGCWLIREGRVGLDIHVPGRGDVLIETLGAGTVLGWSWLFPPYRWQFGAVAAEQTLAVRLDGPGVRRLCAEDPALGYELTQRFMAVVVDRLQATRLRLFDLYGYPLPAAEPDQRPAA